MNANKHVYRIRVIFATILLSVFFITNTFAQSTGKLQPVDIFDLEYVSDPEISPSGNRVLYVRNFKDIMTDQNLSNIWVVNLDGSQNLPITTGNQKDRSPQWSADATRIAYLSDKHGSTQIYMRWLQGGYETKLTNLHGSPKNLSWSPNGKWIAFNMFVEEPSDTLVKLKGKPKGAKWNEPARYIDEMEYRSDGASGFVKSGHEQLFVISTDGGTPRQLTFANNDVGKADWGKDHETLYFHANLHEDADYNPRNSEIHRVNLSDNQLLTLTERSGPDNNPKVSPDGRQIVFTGYDDLYQGYQRTRLYLMDLGSRNVEELIPDFDRDIQDVNWSKDGKGLFFQYQDFGNNHIAYLKIGGKPKTIAGQVGGLSLGRPYTRGSYSVASNGSLAFTFADWNHPADLAIFDGSQVSRLTTLNDDLFSFRKPGKVEEIRYKSSYDQREIQGWICYPPEFDPSKKYPLILEIHGGPFLAYGPWFSLEIQLYAAAGYVVLYINPRGSTSYGEEFGNLIHHNYPGQDYDDLMSGVDTVVEKGFIDGDQLFVTGGSGGGVLTAWIVGKTDRFRAAVVAKPVINWYSFVLYSDGTSYHKYWFPGVPWEHQQHYMERSPISLVGNVTTPTLLLTGESDYRTPIAETEQYYRALKLQKVDAAMVRIPGSSHGIAARPSNLMAKVENILAWFNRYKEQP